MKNKQKVYMVAEAGVNHNGNLDLALELCDKAKEVGADAVKFQTFRTEQNISRYAEMAEYQRENIRKEKTQYEMIKELELSFKDFERIKTYCDKIKMQFLSTPKDEESLSFLISLGLETIKIGSGEVDNLPYLRKIGETRKDIILSTGMATLGEVAKAYFTLLDNGAKSVVILHCTTDYPCLIEEVNLAAMLALKEAFKTKVGYSDHTIGIEVASAAVALGAEIIEKHFTLDKNLEGPDHRASADPKEFTEMVKAVRTIEKAMGDGIKRPTERENRIKKYVRRSLVASIDIKAGDIITMENTAVKRPGVGIPPEFREKVMGMRVAKDIRADSNIGWEDFKYT